MIKQYVQQLLLKKSFIIINESTKGCQKLKGSEEIKKKGNSMFMFYDFIFFENRISQKRNGCVKQI